MWPTAEAFQQDTARAARCIDSGTGLPTLPISSSPTCDAVSTSLYTNLGCPECAEEANSFTALLPACLQLRTQGACEGFRPKEDDDTSMLRSNLNSIFRPGGEEGISDTEEVTSSAKSHLELEPLLGGGLHVYFGILCYFLLSIYQNI